jgi:hypothetical protein
MSVSLQEWLRIGWLIQHHSSPDEIKKLLGVVDRDLADCQTASLSNDWRFAIAYNAGLQAAAAALAAAGYRASRDSHHYRVIQSLELTVGADAKLIRSFEAFRKKRNVSNYEVGGSISDSEVKEMIDIATRLRREVESWIRTNHPKLL